MRRQEYFESIRRGDLPRLRRLLVEDPALLDALDAPDYDPERSSDSTGLHVAVHAGQLEVARVLVDAGIDLEAVTFEGRTALHDSIEFGQREIQQLLIERGARIDICAAAILGRIDDLRRMLVQDPELANDRATRLSPLGWAAFGNQCEIARTLIEHGARMDDGELLCAASVGHVDVGRLLIEHGADPDAFDEGAGGNALHAAVSMKYAHDSRPFIQLLLDRGVDLGARPRQGQTALELAEARAREQTRQLAEDRELHRKPFAEVAAMLRQHGA